MSKRWLEKSVRCSRRETPAWSGNGVLSSSGCGQKGSCRLALLGIGCKLAGATSRRRHSGNERRRCRGAGERSRNRNWRTRLAAACSWRLSRYKSAVWLQLLGPVLKRNKAISYPVQALCVVQKGKKKKERGLWRWWEERGTYKRRGKWGTGVGSSMAVVGGQAGRDWLESAVGLLLVGLLGCVDGSGVPLP